MLVKAGNQKVWLIGDPHLCRDFKNGTPLHRRGEREAMQMAQFKAELATDADMIVMVGDLFDKPIVPLPDLNAVIEAVLDAAFANTHVRYIYMAGNHDKSRQVSIRGAWEIFDHSVSWVPNITVVNEPTAIEGIMFYPWQWGVPALEQVEQHGSSSCHTAIGHWDLQSFGGDDSHICPVKALLNLNPNVSLYSGHYHEEKTYQLEGVNVVCTGSMQPYTHAEDPTGELYVTLTLAEALARDDLQDKCVRVLLEPGESLPQIDCLQLTPKRVGKEVNEIEMADLGLGGFDVAGALKQEMSDNEVPAQVQIFILEKLGGAD